LVLASRFCASRKDIQIERMDLVRQKAHAPPENDAIANAHEAGAKSVRDYCGPSSQPSIGVTLYAGTVPANYLA
jgi:hypothetical protein